MRAGGATLSIPWPKALSRTVRLRGEGSSLERAHLTAEVHAVVGGAFVFIHKYSASMNHRLADIPSSKSGTLGKSSVICRFVS